ncbi:MAG: hypothetical protein M3352_06020 [Bacteroidota bacterium]|nr:hypothetical protein [Bacteroidota bacterium]
MQGLKDWNLPGLSIVIVSGGKPALPLSAYTGIYSDPLYGTLNISQKSIQLLIQFNKA